MATTIQRQTAYLCTVADLKEGSYVRREGWEPSFFATGKGAISRVRLAGIIVERQGNAVTLDDGTGQIPMRVFDAALPLVHVGDPVMVIGRPRVYNDEKYVLIEILRKTTPKRLQEFAGLREELGRYIPPVPEIKEPEKEAPAKEASPQPVTTRDQPQQLIDLIREMDPGDGAAVDEVLAKAGPDAEKKLQFLIAEGEVFELRAGKVKVLE
jgi:hypothetical protein